MLKSLKISAKLAGISALLLAVGAVDAEASFALNIATSADQLVAPGASGQSYFDLTFSGSGQSTFVRNDLWAVDENGNQLTQGVDSPFTSLTIDSSSSLHTTSGTKYSAGTYRVVVDWALASDVLPSMDDYAKDMGVWHVAAVLPQVIATPFAGFLLDNFQRVGKAQNIPNLGYTVIFSIAVVFFALGTFFVKQIKGVR